MEIEKNVDKDVTTFMISGKIDTVTSQKLQDSLIPVIEVSDHVVLDFSKVEYVSSAGLRVLLMGEKTAKANGVSMTVTNVSDAIMEVLLMTGFANILTLK